MEKHLSRDRAPRFHGGDLVARVDYVWQDYQTFLEPAPEPNSQGAYGLLNARLTLEDIEMSGGSLKVSLWGKNLTDKSYRSTGIDLSSSFGYMLNTIGAPRTYGLDISFKL